MTTRYLLFVALTMLLACSSSDGSKATVDAVNSLSDSETMDVLSAQDLVDPEETLAGMDGGSDLGQLEDLGGEEPDVVVPESLCGQPQLAQCEATTEAPTSQGEKQTFAKNNAFRLRCPESGADGWDFAIFGQQFEGHQAFFMGEVHGSNEIGQASADLMEYMVRTHGATVIALEIGMDTTADMQHYVVTGAEASLKAIGIDQYGDNMFRKLLPERARQLYLEGFDIQMVGFDVPQRLAWLNEELEALAQAMSDDTAKGLLLDTMPPPREIASYGMMGLEQAYVDKAEDYYNHVLDNLTEICAALPDEASCKRAEMLAYSFWIGAVFVSQDFMMGSMGGGDQMAMMQMMMEREQILIWTFQNAIPDDDTICYGHMGAAHASKGGWNVAGQLDKYYDVTKNQIYTVTPAYGPGSAIFYGFSSQALPTEPKAVGEALATMPEDRYFLSTNHPGLDCTENPFVHDMVTGLGVEYGQSYDAFFFYDKLTADKPGGWWYAGNSAWEQFFIDQVQRLSYAQELMARTHDLY